MHNWHSTFVDREPTQGLDMSFRCETRVFQRGFVRSMSSIRAFSTMLAIDRVGPAPVAASVVLHLDLNVSTAVLERFISHCNLRVDLSKILV